MLFSDKQKLNMYVLTNRFSQNYYLTKRKFIPKGRYMMHEIMWESDMSQFIWTLTIKKKTIILVFCLLRNVSNDGLNTENMTM